MTPEIAYDIAGEALNIPFGIGLYITTNLATEVASLRLGTYLKFGMSCANLQSTPTPLYQLYFGI